MLYQNITETVGNTPLVKINNIIGKSSCNIYAKLESLNPMSSVKDRIAKGMIDTAEREGKLRPGATIVEPTSGNTGIGLAFISSSRGYKLILTMPDTMSIERRNLLKALGAELILTPGVEGMTGAINKAKEILNQTPDAYMPQQFENPANPEAHRKTTALEILKDLDENIDIFVAGIGTGGTITGVGEVLKKKNPNVQIVAVEPETSAVLSGKAAGPHKIQGIGAGFIPKILNTQIFDRVITVSDSEAGSMANLLAKKEGILVGISAGAAMQAALQMAKLEQNKNIVVILPDSGERYLSTWLFKKN